MQLKKRTPKFPITLMSILIIGTLIRLYLAASANYKIDFDEAMIGLLSTNILNNSHSAFIPGQPTIGTLEPYLLTPLFITIGASTIAIRIYALIINMLYITSVYFLGEKIGNKPVAIVSALLAALAPAYMLITGMKIWGTTIEAITLGNFLLLSNANAIARNTRTWYAITGFIAGIMLWSSWLSVYYLIPCALLWIIHIKKTYKQLIITIALFIFGSLPFWIHNIIHPADSFATILNATSEARHVSRLDTLVNIITVQYPMLVTGYTSWITLPSITVILATSLYSVGILSLIIFTFKTKNHYSALLIGTLIVIPIIYTQSGYGKSSFNEYGIDSTGRYLLMLHSILPIAVASIIMLVKSKYGFILPIGIILINLSTVPLINTSRAFDSPYYNRQPDDLGELINYLVENDYKYVWTDVGIAQPLTFISHHTIIAADYNDYNNGGILRFPDIFNQVNNAAFTVYVVPVIPGQVDPPIELALEAASVDYTTRTIGTLNIYIPNRPVHPSEVIDGLGLQY